MTMGFTLRRTARRISRLKGACVFIPSAYLPSPQPDPRVSAALAVRGQPHVYATTSRFTLPIRLSQWVIRRDFMD